ncbi:hypothetical protein WHR41_08282 [Cladosporium halotolerans]|uniref:L-ornithine N(5)-monooxygenase [NAD(P)H] n=1 Tax=Cladosporium halotolerans TaxID=1052096 RepID=A0AB34KDY2_9PEZI
MSPHAVPLTPTRSNGSGNNMNGHVSQTNGHRASRQAVPSSHLQRFPDSEVQDLVCVGFGPASLAIAVALHDAIDKGDAALGTSTPKVRFLERQQQFAWHAGMLLPGAKMQITFIKDMATFRDPRSEFTFLNYLHENGRLVSFTNLGTFLPQRIEYEDYMRWCAEHFEEVVEYGQDVTSVDVSRTNPQTGAAEEFKVTSTDQTTGRQTTTRAKHVVIAAGGRPSIPKQIPANHPRVIHSSQYATHIDQIFPPGQGPRSVAVIGGGQSAAECFHNIHSRYPGCKSNLIIRGAALKPSDDSPFVNEIFDPERVDDIWAQDPVLRAEAIARDKATNYGVVRIELLEEIYTAMYTQRILYDSEDDWPQRILNHRTIDNVEELPGSGKAPLRLHIRNETSTFSAAKKPTHETLDVDLVVVASGYVRNAHEEMLRNVRHLMPGGDQDSEKRWSVNRNYKVQTADGAVAPDAGLWLQGCNEKTHGLSDSLLSILAVRGGEMVENIFGSEQQADYGAVAEVQ